MAAEGSSRVISWNMKGLNTPEKRSFTLLELHRLRGDIGFLQETHFKADSGPKLHNHKYLTAYNLCAEDSKTKGVSILIGKRVPWTWKATWSDQEGRLFFVKGLIGSQMCTLATIYSSNSSQITFLEKVLEQLNDFPEGMLVLGGGGDFNLTLTT